MSDLILCGGILHMLILQLGQLSRISMMHSFVCVTMFSIESRWRTLLSPACIVHATRFVLFCKRINNLFRTSSMRSPPLATMQVSAIATNRHTFSSGDVADANVTGALHAMRIVLCLYYF